MKKRLEENHGEIPKARLWEVVDDEWERTSADYCKRLFSSMPKRLAAVIKAKGGIHAVVIHQQTPCESVCVVEIDVKRKVKFFFFSFSSFPSLC